MPTRKTTWRPTLIAMALAGAFIAWGATTLAAPQHDNDRDHPHEHDRDRGHDEDHGHAADHDGGHEGGHEMPSSMKQYVVALIYRGPVWSPEETPESAEMQQQHLANIGRLAREGKMVMAGPFGDDGDLRGLFFFDVESVEAAEKLCAADPAISSGRLRVELHPWWGPKSLRGVLDEWSEEEAGGGEHEHGHEGGREHGHGHEHEHD